MPILKLEIFQNSKSQKCKLWGRPSPPLFLGKSLHFEFFFMTASLMCLCAHLFGNVSFLLSDPWPTGDRCGDYHIGAYVVITTLMLK